MMKGGRLGVLALLVIFGLTPGIGPAPSLHASVSAIEEPVLKWQCGGCYSSWCETGWYSSPAVADLDDDGTIEVIAGAYSIFVLNGENGAEQWPGKEINPPGDRVWPGVVVADIDDDGDLEFVTAHGQGYLNIFDHAGNIVWTRHPVSNELRGLSVYDLDDDGTLDVIVTAARGSQTNTWVYDHNGNTRSGWPQLAGESGYAWGVFNDNAAIGDLDDDGMGEIVVPSDVHYICAYERNGAQIPANAMYGGKGWGKVGVWEDLTVELRGWGTCDPGDGRAERYRPNFADGPAAIADMDGDGVVEVVATGNVYDCISGYPSKYMGAYIFNADRSRFNTGGYDWRTTPIDTGAPLSQDWHVIESAMPNPALADLDGDGELEIIYASYDGRMHAFWLDKSGWTYSVYTGGPYRFASEPVVADLDNDGYAEVIFGSWVRKGTNQTGKLHILDYQGNVVHEVDLPDAYGSPDWNGALAAPTLANIDADADLEVVLNTAHSGVVAYDLPDTADARVLWGTGRGNYQRTGSILQGSLRSSQVSVQPVLANPGDTLAYTILLQNSGETLPSAWVTSTLPVEVTYAGDLWASSGSFGEAGGVITWTGAVATDVPVTVTYSAVIPTGPISPTVIVNPVLIDDGLGNVDERFAISIVNGLTGYLPMVSRE
jgi:uncharacterized repeat protein (TIGR01451 family)